MWDRRVAGSITENSGRRLEAAAENSNQRNRPSSARSRHCGAYRIWVQPKMVAQIEFGEWTHSTDDGPGSKLRAPVFLGLRDDKDPKECRMEESLK